MRQRKCTAWAKTFVREIVRFISSMVWNAAKEEGGEGGAEGNKKLSNSSV